MNISKCRSCGEEIVWMKTEAGKNIPVNVESIADKEAPIFDPDQMISHFATCKDANTWRKKK
jgi:hypothetical protein